MLNYVKAIALGAALTLPVVVVARDLNQPNAADPQTRHYDDKAHNDSHEWNNDEDQAYRRYLKEHHKKYHEFSRASKREQADYWKWRHEHHD